MELNDLKVTPIVALRNEKGSYNAPTEIYDDGRIVALRNEKGSYNESNV